MGEAVRVHRVGMVLGGDFDFAGLQIFHRMVAAPVPELQLVGSGAVGQGDDLVAQADTEDGNGSQQLPDRFDGLGHVGRVPGPIGNEDAVRLQ